MSERKMRIAKCRVEPHVDRRSTRAGRPDNDAIMSEHLSVPQHAPTVVDFVFTFNQSLEYQLLLATSPAQHH
jgi:hypothetical protein